MQPLHMQLNIIYYFSRVKKLFKNHVAGNCRVGAGLHQKTELKDIKIIHVSHIFHPQALTFYAVPVLLIVNQPESTYAPSSACTLWLDI